LVDTAVPEVIYYVAASVDGYIATPDSGIEWLAPFEETDEDYGYAQFYESVEAVLLGRRTYETSLAFHEWPYPGKPCWVFSHGNIRSLSTDVTRTAQNPTEVMSEIETRGLRRAWLVGGGALAASFRSQGLITEYIVTIVPVILGAGVPLFADSGPLERLKLVEANSYPKGLVQLRYLRAEET
jgi:dihydrofolate reductase